jgi:hypothetical protein
MFRQGLHTDEAQKLLDNFYASHARHIQQLTRSYRNPEVQARAWDAVGTARTIIRANLNASVSFEIGLGAQRDRLCERVRPAAGYHWSDRNGLPHPQFNFNL